MPNQRNSKSISQEIEKALVPTNKEKYLDCAGRKGNEDTDLHKTRGG